MYPGHCLLQWPSPGIATLFGRLTGEEDPAVRQRECLYNGCQASHQRRRMSRDKRAGEARGRLCLLCRDVGTSEKVGAAKLRSRFKWTSSPEEYVSIHI